MKAALHPREPERLSALQAFGILDSDPEKDFDDIVKLAASLCGADASTVTFIAEGRQWFKAAVGMPEWVAPIELAFCAHTILEQGFVEIPDTREDPRTADNPLCASEGGCRFYAGALLKTREGLPLGTLCVLGFTPHKLNALQREALQVLANQIMKMLELRQALKLAEILRQEVDHRVKNSLQAIASFTGMQSRNTTTAEARGVLDVVQRHIQTAAALHDLLYKTETEGTVDLGLFLKSVADFISQAVPEPLRLECSVESVKVSPVKATKAALIVNEFATNAIKHAFPDGRPGRIAITGRNIGGGRLEIICRDDGVGLPGNPAETKAKGLGLKIIEASAAQMQASVTWATGGPGLGMTLTFPIDG